MNMGDMIKNRRLELGLTLEDVGKAVGVGKSTVRKWESGQIKDMKRDKISALANVLKLSPVSFIFSDADSSHSADKNTNNSEKTTLTKSQVKLLDLLPNLTEDDIDDLLLLAKSKADRHKSRDDSV